jgi:hypothetical protein
VHWKSPPLAGEEYEYSKPFLKDMNIQILPHKMKGTSLLRLLSLGVTCYVSFQ